MATTESRSCRICGSIVSPTHCIALFSSRWESLASGFADRLSKVADVPVAPDDGLSKFICRICNRKLLSAESFITTAKLVIRRIKPHSLALVRTKDTSGHDASPHTSQCRPVAKQLTAERPGRRLTYQDCHNSQTDNFTDPMSDSTNDQDTTDGPGGQE